MSEQSGRPPQDAARLMKSIRRIVRAIDTRSKQIVRETGLTIPQIVVLSAVRDLGEVTTLAISRYADLSAATTVMILEKLEQRGLVTRTRSRIDRRVVHTALTPIGARMLAAAPPLLHDRFTTALRALTRDRRTAIVAAFDEVAELLDPSAPDTAPLLGTEPVG